MKLKAPDAVAARTRSPINWFLGICLAGFLTIISASAAAPPPSAEELNAAEKWVVERVTAGEEADLSKQFPEEKDRKLSAHFLEDLLMGPLLHRHGVRITRAIIDESIDLKNAQIPCEVRFDHCQFNKSVTFSGATFAAGLSFHGSRVKELAHFSGMKVRGSAEFGDVVFVGPGLFVGADIAGNLNGESAKFQKFANFDGMKVRGDASFDHASFEGLAVFHPTDIAGNLWMESAKFQTAYFEEMKVGGGAYFGRTVFKGEAYFEGTDIAGNFDAGTKFQKGAYFARMKVGGDASFNHASFEGLVDLRYADFGSLDVSGASWPKDPARFQMQGVSYKTILAAPKEPKSHEELLKVVSQAAYSADVYSRLEEFFLRQGYRADADEAFITGKVRERKEYFRSGDWFGWLRSWMLDLLVGYGRQPWRAGIPCAVLIALGCVLFSPKKMEPQNPEDTPRVYSRFWYSLNLFLPVVDLQAGKVWKPKADQTFLRNYMRVHILLGWILVPLVLAAVTGLIK